MAFLRALAYRESGMRPTLDDGPAAGLMQVVPILQKEWNQRTGENVTRTGLLNPDKNVQIASDLLNRIIAGYAKHPDKNLKLNWNNPEFVKLLVAGWNSGYSEGGGVGRVASYLEARGIPVTHDNVFKYASAAGATQYLQSNLNPTRQPWQRSVADLFYKQPDFKQSVQKASTKDFLKKAAIATALGLLTATFVFKR